jgi:hypothetical protein
MTCVNAFLNSDGFGIEVIVTGSRLLCRNMLLLAKSQVKVISGPFCSARLCNYNLGTHALKTCKDVNEKFGYY